ncbi:MAG TPA: L,D-transpeptidase [Candidatus Limiplasma sp.]|nr:L,D-transpeptidase [Candidatus Limiplasma sp.]
MKVLYRAAITLLCALLLMAGLPNAAQAKTVAEWLEGYESGENWFGEDFDYDITDTAACWELLMRPITVLNVAEREVVYPLVTPGGAKVNEDKLGGFIAGSTAAVHVLGKDEDGWTLIEGLDDYDRLIRGYVRTKLLKTVTPNQQYGVIIDKMTQRLYVFINGEYFSSVAISTGLTNDDQPYNETSAGEYLISSWVGGFDSEGMYVEMGMRFNNGDLLHQVPYVLLGDGTKRFEKYEKLLGQKASHGCVRVARIASEEGLNIKWLWDNLKKGTKVVIWDDDGRVIPYPDDSTLLYYNKDGGKYYHDIANCGMVKEQYLPLSSFTYAELDTAPFSELEPCPGCAPAKRKSVIDELNAARGLQTSLPEVTQSPAPDATNAAEMLSEGQTVAPSSLDSVNDPEVEINIFPAK